MNLKELQVVEVKGIRTLTSKQLAECYGTTTDIIKKNFSRNRERYVEEKHYICFSGDELKEFKYEVTKSHAVNKQVTISALVGNRASHLYLWTEKGALLHAKSLNTDKAWEVYDYLVDFYFRAKEQLQITQTKPEPVKKPSGREVVDIPENAEIQAAIQEVHKQLVAMDSVLKAYNRYQCKENYLNLESTLELLWHETGRKIINLMDIEPNLIVKQGY